MGGANAGDVASQTARDTIAEFVRQNRRRDQRPRPARRAIQAASRAVHQAARLAPRPPRHGHDRGRVPGREREARVIAHVGDSRAYLLRGGRLIQLTRDHTIVAELVDRGAISREDAEATPTRTCCRATSAPRPEARVDFNELELKAAIASCCAPTGSTATPRSRRSSTCSARATRPSTSRATSSSSRCAAAAATTCRRSSSRPAASRRPRPSSCDRAARSRGGSAASGS